MNEQVNNLDHADVRIPPPLIYIAGFVLGLLLERAFPVLVLPKTPSRVAAVLCIALWAILTVWSIGLFHRARTSFLPIKPTTGEYKGVGSLFRFANGSPSSATRVSSGGIMAHPTLA